MASCQSVCHSLMFLSLYSFPSWTSRQDGSYICLTFVSQSQMCTVASWPMRVLDLGNSIYEPSVVNFHGLVGWIKSEIATCLNLKYTSFTKIHFLLGIQNLSLMWKGSFLMILYFVMGRICNIISMCHYIIVSDLYMYVVWRLNDWLTLILIICFMLSCTMTMTL